MTLLPKTVAAEVTPLMEHWLFCSVADVPSVIGPSHALFPLLRNDKEARAGSTHTQQALAPLIAVFITNCAKAISEAPF